MHSFTQDEIKDLITNQISGVLSIPAHQISTDATFDSYGIDSANSVLMVGKLEDFLDVELPTTLLWDFNTIQKLSDHLYHNINLYQ
jgi:acyl carrier protein